jgi:hypothetical protein
MADPRLKELRGTSRRQFLRWSATVAACVGLERSRLLNVINDTAGTAAADKAQCATTFRHIHVLDGTGGFANWTLPFAIPRVIKGNNPQFSHYAVGKGTDAQGYDKPYAVHPDAPWQTNTSWKVSAFVGGQAQIHSDAPNQTNNTVVGQNNMLAAAAAIQQANPTLLPVLTVGGNLAAVYGNAPGAPATAAVGSANALVDLFNSKASKALLAGDVNGPMQESYYKAFLGLNAAAGRSTVAKAYGTGKVSMTLLAKNLGPQLTPTAADLALFGIGTGTPGAVQNIGRAMITTMKAFSLGLTSMMVVRGFNNDPHGMFAGGDGQATNTGQSMGKMLDGLHALGKSLQDPSCSSKTLADALVFSVSGDTYKAPFDRNGWGDNTPRNSNILYMMGAGQVKTGWFGEIVDTNTVRPWDIATGNTIDGDIAGVAGQLGNAAAAALLFAIAKGDMRRVRDFYNGPDITNIVNLNVTGS